MARPDQTRISPDNRELLVTRSGVVTGLAASEVVMESYWVLGQRLDFLATGATTGGHYSLFHVFIPAGPPGPLPHIHRNADEFFFVVEGRIEVLLEDAWHPLGPGQFLHVPRGTLHTFQNVTTDAARMLSGFVPSGFERFFRDFGHPAQLEDVEPLPVQEAEIQRLKATASQYDMELVACSDPAAGTTQIRSRRKATHGR